jgi:hypothetical protein
MDIHKPKAAHSPREFLIEIGTIVVGILIALSLEQLVDTLRERHAIAEAREAVRGELVANLAGMRRRERAQACLNRRLDELGKVLEAAKVRKSYATPKWVGRPNISQTVSQRWDAASQSGRASLFPNGEQADYAAFYYNTHVYEEMQTREQETWAALRGMEGTGAWTSSDLHDFSQALSRARYENWRMGLVVFRAQETATKLKITAAPAQPLVSSVVPSTCVPISSDRATAMAIIKPPAYGEP